MDAWAPWLSAVVCTVEHGALVFIVLASAVLKAASKAVRAPPAAGRFGENATLAVSVDLGELMARSWAVAGASRQARVAVWSMGDGGLDGVGKRACRGAGWSLYIVCSRVVFKI